MLEAELVQHVKFMYPFMHNQSDVCSHSNKAKFSRFIVSSSSCCHRQR